MIQPIVQVDAFTDRPFSGNPAGVCLLSEERDAEWMQATAAEMNLSETAFVQPSESGSGFDLRWFTPRVEVDLCGHATLASAHVLFETGVLPSDAVARFHTRSGLLTAIRSGALIELDFPALAPEPQTPPPELIEALRVRPVAAGRNRMDWLIELESEAEVRRATPDFVALAAAPARGVIITSRSSGEFDFVSRFFAPAVGVPEDPVTGSAHCALAPWWQERLGRQQMTGYQASARGGTVHVRVEDGRVMLSGAAVTVLRGELLT